LQFLIENRDRTVPKEEIVAAVWPDTFVSDNSITRAVTQVRKALQDDAKEPKYIETVPTVGYRFVGECKEVPRPSEGPATYEAPGHASRWGTKRWQLVAAASLALAILAMGAHGGCAGGAVVPDPRS
jgi:DNA-binding winged helix-turn-helix (wHTH) protein